MSVAIRDRRILYRDDYTQGDYNINRFIYLVSRSTLTTYLHQGGEKMKSPEAKIKISI